VKFFILSLLALSCLAHEGHDHGHDHGDEGHDEHVLTLNPTNFDTTVSSSDMLLVEFYAPWCGHCKRLAPEYEKAASELWGKVSLAKVDCTENQPICDRYGVQGFPTIKLFRKDGSVSDYEAGRTAPEIVKFLKKQSQTAFTVVHTLEDLEQVKGSDNLVLVVATAEDSHLAAEFKKVANQLRSDAGFAIVVSETVRNHLGVAHDSVTLLRNFDEPIIAYTGAINGADMTKFVKMESFPLVGEIGPENYAKYVERELPLIWIFLDMENTVQSDQILADAKVVAGNFRGQVSFVQLDGKRWNSHAKNLGLSSSTPGIVLEDRVANKKFIFPEAEINVATLGGWLGSWKDKALLATVKSQEIPDDNSGPVRVLVAKSFDEIVKDASKDVLVEFYAPWCGHCKTLAPKYEELGQIFQDTPSVIIAKMDSTENDSPAEVSGFPTLIFYPANNKAGMVYRGERSTEALEAYIRENGVTIKAKVAAAAASEVKHAKTEL